VSSDLSPLLEASLCQEPWIRLISARTVYERVYKLDPWLAKGIWEDSEERGSAEVYFQLRERWIRRTGARLPAEYVILGRVIPTGERKNFIFEVLRSAPPPEVLFRTSRATERDEEIPEAVDQIAGEIQGYLQLPWSRRYMEGILRKYLAQLCSLEVAVREAEQQVLAHPENLVFRLLLLTLCVEKPGAYGGRILEEAAHVVRSLDPWDEALNRLIGELGTDPFLILCQELARRNDWQGVLRTSFLGMEKHPLGAGAYRKWQARAERELNRNRMGRGGPVANKGVMEGKPLLRPR
jgi:hypothetical protein